MGSNNSPVLQAWPLEKLADLRQELDATAQVFEFDMYVLAQGETISVDLHQRALALSFFLETNCLAANSVLLTKARVSQLIEVNHLDHAGSNDSLFVAFKHPPYSMTESDEEVEQLFDKLCNAVGLRPEDDIEVLDWLGDPNVDPQRSEWTDNFDAGKEWWGIWCLTIWNPVSRTICVLTASTTD